MESLFLYQQWLGAALHEYVTSAHHPLLKGRPIRLSPRQFGAALMQAYLGRLSLPWISRVMDLPVALLHQWRREPEFLLVMDWSKSAFGEAMREDLALTDYSVAQVRDIAGEFSLLEDSLRVIVRTRLYQVLKNLGEALARRHQSGLPLARHDLHRFRRLLLFFVMLEQYAPSAARQRLLEQFLPLAREVIWPLLGREWRDPPPGYPLSRLRDRLAEKLREAFVSLPRLS